MAGQRENASGPIFRSDDIYPNQDHDDDVRKRTRRMIEGDQKGKNLCFQHHVLISLCQNHTLIVTAGISAHRIMIGPSIITIHTARRVLRNTRFSNHSKVNATFCRRRSDG